VQLSSGNLHGKLLTVPACFELPINCALPARRENFSKSADFCMPKDFPRWTRLLEMMAEFAMPSFRVLSGASYACRSDSPTDAT